MTAKKPHPIRELLTAYDEAYERKIGVRAPIVHGKDSKLAQQLLSRYSLEQLIEWIGVFFKMRDPFIEQSGYGFGVFVACLGKVIVAASRLKPKANGGDARSGLAAHLAKLKDGAA